MPHDLSAPTLKVTGAARFHRAASSDRRERGRAQGYVSRSNFGNFSKYVRRPIFPFSGSHSSMSALTSTESMGSDFPCGQDAKA